MMPLLLTALLLLAQGKASVAVAPEKADVNVDVLEGAGSQDSQSAAQKAAQSELQKRGLAGFLLFAMGGGLVSLIMPCVYPLIPVTLTYFVKQGAGSRAKGVFLSVAYAAGIVIVFTGIGFCFSLVLGESGARKFAANPWVNIGVGLLFLWFTFSLFGLYEIRLPSWLTGAVSGAPRSGAGGAFILGALFSVVTFTCTIPVAATILAVSASSAGNARFIGLLAMLAYSGTMALPFLFLGLFPSLIKEVPKSGGWLHTVKVSAGFAELALALVYFAKADFVWALGFLTRELMVTVWTVVLAAMMIYLFGFLRIKGDDEGGRPAVGIPRLLIGLAFGVCALFMATGFSGKRLGLFDAILPPVKGDAFATLPPALEKAAKENRPVFVEFTGGT